MEQDFDSDDLFRISYEPICIRSIPILARTRSLLNRNRSDLMQEIKSEIHKLATSRKNINQLNDFP